MKNYITIMILLGLYTSVYFTFATSPYICACLCMISVISTDTFFEALNQIIFKENAGI